MKILTVQRRNQATLRRVFVAFSVVAMLVATTNSANAQLTGGLLKFMSSGPDSAIAKTATTKKTPVQSSVQRAGSKPAQIVNAGKNYRVVSSATVRTAADAKPTATQGYRGRIGSAVHQASAPTKAGAGKVQQVGFSHLLGTSSCNSCGTSACGGSCRFGSHAKNFGMSNAGPCGGICNPYRYLVAEALFIQRRGDDNFSLSQNFSLDDWDFEAGPRITIGTLPDCVHGCEATLTGPMEWDMSGQLTDPAGNIQTLLIPGNPVPAASLSAFSNANFQSQRYTADYLSLEASKTLVGWDVAKLLLGARYIDYDESYNYFSQTATETGLLTSDVENRLLGAQVGMDLLYPIGRFAYTDFRGRAGAYLNLAESNVGLVNGGSRILNTADEDAELAGVFELGTGIRYQLGSALSVRVGTELWYLTGIATAPDQIDQVVRPTTGRSVRIDDDVLFYGMNLGFELRW